MSFSKSKPELAFHPKVSIIIPVFNGSDYLKEAVESALAQTYKNIEIVIVNDGSDDNGNTENIALSFGNKIRYFNKENGGVATALNLGINEMTGEYFSWLSHDDLYYPYKIEKQINFLQNLEDKDVFLFSDFEFIDENGIHIKDFRVKPSRSKYPELSIIFNQIHGCSTLISRNILLKVNCFPEDKLTTQDYHTWVKLFKAGYKFYHQPFILIKSRIHENQGTKTMSEICKKDVYEFYEFVIDETACHCHNNYYKIQEYYYKLNIELFHKLNSALLRTNSNNHYIYFKVTLFVFIFKIQIIMKNIKYLLSKHLYYK